MQIFKVVTALLITLITSQTSIAAPILIDDFSTPVLDCSNWWFGSAEGAVTHDAIDGEVDILLKPYTSESGTCRNRLRPTPENEDEVRSIAANIRINSIHYDPAMRYTEARIYGNFFNTQDANTTVGEVEAILHFGDRGNGLEAWWTILETLDAYYKDLEIIEGTIIPPGSLTTGVYYPMSLDYDGEETFVFSINGISQTFTWGTERNAGPVEYYLKEIQARVATEAPLIDTSGQNDISISVDDVEIGGIEKDGGVYFRSDNFDSFLDSSVWREGLQSVTTDSVNGKLDIRVEAQTAPLGNLSTRLFVGDENGLSDTVTMDISLDNVTFGSWGRTRIAGSWYNAIMSQGQYNGFEGNVWAKLELRRETDGSYRAIYYLEYAMDQFWTQATEMGFGEFSMAIIPGDEYEISIHRSDTGLEFSIDNGLTQETINFDALTPFLLDDGTTITPITCGTPASPHLCKATPGTDEKSFSTQLRDTAGIINTSFDNITVEEVLAGSQNTADTASTIIGNSGIDSAVNIGASAEPGEPYHGDIGTTGVAEKSVWFEWTAPDDGAVTFDTAGSNFDTLLSIYDVSGQSTSSLVNDRFISAALAIDFSQYTKLDGNNDANENVSYSEVRAEVEQGKTYRIAVDGNNGEEGLAILNYSLDVAPDDSLCFPIKARNGNIVLICL